MSDFCEPGDDDVDAPFVLRQVDGAEPGDRVDAEHRPAPSRDLVQRTDVVDDAGRGLRLGDEDRARRALRLGSAASRRSGSTFSPHSNSRWVVLAP